EAETLRQILVDLPRTCPELPFFHQPPVQRSMERILYLWSIRHPASGYVQGINDLLTPLFVVFMSVYVGKWLIFIMSDLREERRGGVHVCAMCDRGCVDV